MGDMPTQRMVPPAALGGLLQRIHDTHWELHDIGYSLHRGMADAEDVRYTVGMLRELAVLLNEQANGMA